MSQTSRPLVLLVNPNSNASTTALMVDVARTTLDPVGLEVRGVTAASGPAMIVGATDLERSAGEVLDAARRGLADDEGRVVAIVVAAFGDPGREALAAAVDVPVVGIGQSSLMAAAAGGRRFGMATTTPGLVGSLEAMVRRHDVAAGFAGIRLTRTGPTALAERPELQDLELEQAARACFEEDGAEAVIIAGGPLSGAARRIAASGIGTVVEPVPAAMRRVLDLR
ncbi:aspartate/glutamate racemase family protein [Isoptericola sp. NPDC056578]|uniref:aspartate/glutamate racemase family protein n=1 Tax=Isoptericola sp. NPDC056578 TaxID=3345870 RepID=UPI0036757A94